MDDALIGAPDDVAEKIIAKIAEGFPIKDLSIASLHSHSQNQLADPPLSPI